LRLGKRLRALFEAVPDGYDDLWDLGCDHGRLGLALLEAGRGQRIHFVDRLPWLIEGVRERLAQHPPQHWSARAQDARDIVLNGSASELVLLAGVGADQTLAILNAVSERHPDIIPEFLIAPSGPVFRLRHALRESGFRLLQEDFVMERRRGYQLLRVRRAAEGTQELSLTGRFWQPGDPAHHDYLEQQLGHYRRQINSPDKRPLAEAIVNELNECRDWMTGAQPLSSGSGLAHET